MAKFLSGPPKLYVLTEPSFPRTEVSWFTGVEAPDETEFTNSECAIITAGRTCYRSHASGRPDELHIKNLLASGHGSVIEHANFGLLISGVSRSLTHELVRHRHFSFSQESQRYVAEEPEFVIPPNLPADLLPKFAESCEAALATYAQLLGSLPATKAGREVARAVLPNCTATRLAMTGNLRSWRQLILKRGGKGADAEMRRFAKLLLQDCFQYAAPTIFGDITENSEGVLVSTYGAV